MNSRDYGEKEKDLKRERKFLRNIMATIPASLVTIDRELQIKSANNSFYKLFQTMPGMTIGRKIADILGDEGGELSAKLVGLFETKEALEDFELHYQSAILGERILSIAARGIIVAEEEEEEEEEEVLVVIDDVTERRRMEEALRESESKWRSLVQNTPVGILITSVDGRIIEINDTIVQMHGYESKEEFAKSSVAERYYDLKDRARWVALVQKTGKVEGFEVQTKRKDGSLFWVSLTSVVRTTESGEQQLITVSQDITEQKLAEDAIYHSEERFRRLSEASFEGIVISEQGKILDANQTLATMLRCSLSEMIGTSVLDFIAPEYRDLARQNIASEYEQPYELLCVRKDASTFAAEACGKTVTHQGSVVRITVVRDITERKRAEEALRQSEEKYRSLVDNVSLGIFRSTPGPRGKFLAVNKAMEEITGYSRQELLEMDVSNLYVRPEERETVIEEIASARGKMTKELNFMKKDGTEIVVADTKAPVRDGTGKIQYFDGILEDITEHKRMEEDLNFKAQLLDGATDLIHVTDSNWRILYVNEASCLSLGYGRDELLGHDIREFLASGIASRPLPANRDELAGDNVIIETVHIRKDKTLLPVEIHSRIVTWGDRKVWLDVVRDITDRKKMQEQLMAQDRLASIGQLVSGVAHEINNPLTGVIGFSELLISRSDLPDDAKADLKVVNDEAMRTSRIVKNLLAFARKQPEGKAPVDINEQIHRVMGLRGHEQKVNNINVNTRFASDLPQVMGNASQLQQVFFNIVINAEFFMLEAHQKGNLIITTERIGDTVRCSFTDDGPGISEENMKNLFTPFFTTKEVGQGTGLGLSICYGIITEHGGRIYAESEPRKGATFFVELPVKGEATR